MKKSLLSVVLCVALLITAMGTMLAMPASAAGNVDVLAAEISINIPGSTDEPSATANKDGGSVALNFPKDDKSEVVFNLAESVKVKEGGVVTISVESTMKFDLCFFDSNNSKYILAAGDYYPTFNEQVAGSSAQGIVAGTYTNIKFDLAGAYKWNPQTGTSDLEVPDNAEIVTVAIVPKSTGAMTISKLTIGDGIDNISLNSREQQSEDDWDASKTINVLAGDPIKVEATSGDATSNVTVTKNSDGSVSFGNTAALWPAAVYDFSSAPLVVDANAALNVDFNVMAGCKTTIYLFMGEVGKEGSTHTDFGNGTYLWIADMTNPAQVMAEAELEAGNYKGVIYLQDIYKKTIKDPSKAESLKNADGKFVINGIKIHATSVDATAQAEAVKVNTFEILTLKEGVTLPPTTQANSTTTTVNKANTNNGGNSANTGDVSEAALFVVVAAAAVSVVTLSAVSKKAKSR